MNAPPPRFGSRITALATFLLIPTALVAQVAGSLDPAFNPNVSSGVLDSCVVHATAVQADGKIVIGGYFGRVGNEVRNGLVRLNANGSVESATTFAAGDGVGPYLGEDPSDLVSSVLVQPDGKLLLGGFFSRVNGQLRNRVARLHPNGTVESRDTFDPGTGPAGVGLPYTRIAGLQPDGRILVSGFFATFNDQPRNHIVRLHPDGSLESIADFNLGTGPNDRVLTTVVQADGKILIGGFFTSVNGEPRNRLARLNVDGSLEDLATFNPGSGANDYVYSLAVQADGKILLGGEFTSVNDQPRNGIARLNADGTLESTATFNPGTGLGGQFRPYVTSLAVQADGKILLGGEFISINGQPRNYLARLHPNGTVESIGTFDPGTGSDQAVYALALQPDGKILLGGPFTSVDGQSRNRVARLHNDPATQNLTIPSRTGVQWLRGGTSPEVGWVTFELSTDGGASWSLLGSGKRIAGGWEFTGLSLPANGRIRACGLTSGGLGNMSFGTVEAVATFTFPPTSLESWRQQHFGTQVNIGDAADQADPDQDKFVNLVEFALGTNPKGNSALLQPKGEVIGDDIVLTVTQPPGVSGITYGAECSATLQAGSWTDVPDTGTPPIHVFRVPMIGQPKLFLRLKVAIP